MFFNRRRENHARLLDRTRRAVLEHRVRSNDAYKFKGFTA
jgi:hypothetical protein